MFIISKFKDYYDSVIRIAGQDKSIIYKRFIEKHKISSHMSDDIGKLVYPIHDKFRQKGIWVFLIGFCGKEYLGILYEKPIGRGEYKKEVSYGKDIYSLFDYSNKHYKQNIIAAKEIVNRFHNKDAEHFYNLNIPIYISIVWQHNDYLYFIKNFFNKIEYPEAESIDEHNAPGFLTNPKLSYLEFFKVKDHFTAFQEIQSFISGRLTSREKDIVEVSEKNKLMQHGYDKWSFRRQEGPKRKLKHI